MKDAAESKREALESDEAAIAKLAEQTHADVDVVRRLYGEEIAALCNEASVKSFVGVIVARRVKERLLAAAH